MSETANILAQMPFVFSVFEERDRLRAILAQYPEAVKLKALDEVVELYLGIHQSQAKASEGKTGAHQRGSSPDGDASRSSRGDDTPATIQEPEGLPKAAATGAGTQALPVDTLTPARAVLIRQIGAQAVQKSTAKYNSNYSDPMPAPVVAEQMSQIAAAIEGPKPVTRADQIRAVLAKHPDWSSYQTAEQLGMEASDVRAVCRDKGVALKARPKATTGLRQRAIEASAAHPEWTITEVARYLGAAGVGSVSNAVKGLGLVFAHHSPAGQSRKPDSEASRVEAYHLAHPDATARDIANALNLGLSAVTQAKTARGLNIRTMTFEERSQAMREASARSPNRSRKADRAPVEAPQPPAPAEPAPTGAPKPGNEGYESYRRKNGLPKVDVSAEEVDALPIPVVRELSKTAQRLRSEPAAPKVEEPLAFAGDPDEEDGDYVHPSLRRYPAPKAGGKVMLRRADGDYLHCGGVGFTKNRTYAWSGTRAQLAKARQVFPDTKGMQVVQLAVKAK
jgi:hypothetical protein